MGLHDPALVQALAPEGWERSPLVRVYHPSSEQLAEERKRLHDTLERLQGAKISSYERLSEPHEESCEEEPQEPSDPVEECADLLGRCLWDVFSNSHDVLTAEGAVVDLGTFRGSAAF
jgi:hypothetical protein